MTITDTAAETARLRVELEHKDQLLASVYARVETLQGVVERLERQLEAAIEAQREAATERSELRRLLGNAQLQVHALMQLPAPETPGEPPHGATSDEDAPAMKLPSRPDVGGGERPPAAAAAARPPAQRSPQRPAQPHRRQQQRGLVEEARGVFSNLRRMI